jgi:DNA-binding Lrp family transcriptional regulator
MIDLEALEWKITEKADKGIHVAPIVRELIAELKEARKERAAVVAHLRERAIHGVGITISIEDACTILADKIERGEHRREEER